MLQIDGIDHVDLSVSSLARSEAFYGKVLAELGFHREEDGETIFWSNGRMEIGIRAATEEGENGFNRFRVGLHQLAFRARSRSDADAFYAFLLAENLPVLDPPADYPQYGVGYYAVFFSDPDGMKLELVHRPNQEILVG